MTGEISFFLAVLTVCMTALVTQRQAHKATEATRLDASEAKVLRDLVRAATDTADDLTKRVDSWEKILPQVNDLTLDLQARKMRGQ
jgi:hypothetical protein